MTCGDKLNVLVGEGNPQRRPRDRGRFVVDAQLLEAAGAKLAAEAHGAALRTSGVELQNRWLAGVGSQAGEKVLIQGELLGKRRTDGIRPLADPLAVAEARGVGRGLRGEGLHITGIEGARVEAQIT